MIPLSRVHHLFLQSLHAILQLYTCALPQQKQNAWLHQRLTAYGALQVLGRRPGGKVSNIVACHASSHQQLSSSKDCLDVCHRVEQALIKMICVAE